MSTHDFKIRPHLSPLRTDRARRARRSVLAALLALGGVLTGLGGAAQAQAPTRCPDEQFCAYPGDEYRGERVRIDSSPLEQCRALPANPEVKSFVNRTGRPVTVYQDANCDTHAEFATYPEGTFVPRSAFVARAIKVWPH